MKVERVSYDAMTPSAARGVLEAIHWKPAIRWEIARIHVLKPIRFETLRRNELGHKIPARNIAEAMRAASTDGLRTVVEEDRQQRASTLLRDVGYVIEAHFTLTRGSRAGRHRGKAPFDLQSAGRPGGSASIAPISGPANSRPPSPSWRARCLSAACRSTRGTAILAGCCSISISRTTRRRGFSALTSVVAPSRYHPGTR